jgi:hypothetical protein
MNKARQINQTSLEQPTNLPISDPASLCRIIDLAANLN